MWKLLCQVGCLASLFWSAIGFPASALGDEVDLLPQPVIAVAATEPIPDAATQKRLDELEKLVKKPPEVKYPVVGVTGFFHLDAGCFSQSANSMATLGDIQDGVSFRRTQLKSKGKVAEFTSYVVEMDFSLAGRPSFQDVWGEQGDLPFVGNVRLGHFRQPFGMDCMTSIRRLEFLERSLPFQAFVPFLRTGIMAYETSNDELSEFSCSVFRTGGFNNAPLGDDRFGIDIGDNGGASFCTRATHLLWYDEPAEGRYLLHVGGSYNYGRISSTSSGGGFYQSRVIPEIFIGDPGGGLATAAGTPAFADTGRIAANQFNIFGGEIAGQYGAAHFQAEYMATVVDQINGGNVFLDGAYVQAGYFLTGEHRVYSKQVGVFDQVTPFTEFFSLGRGTSVCGWGAWEAVARWSYVNLNNTNAIPIASSLGPPVSPNPGRLNDTTLGLTWFWNVYARMQFNWVHCFLDNRVHGDSNTDIFAARFEMDF